MMTTNTKFLCLHIGCGLNVADDWLNTDTSPSLRLSQIPIIGQPLMSAIGRPKWSKSVKPGDIVKGLKIEEGSCELIFAAHVLEHLSLSDFHIAMQNIYSYLKPGGVFRTIVPGLDQSIEIYHQYRSDNSVSSQAAHKFMESTLLGCSTRRSSVIERLREAFSNSRHQWLWDEPSLADAFVQHGFENVRLCYYGDWSDERFASVEKESNYVGAFGIEGMKKSIA